VAGLKFTRLLLDSALSATVRWSIIDSGPPRQASMAERPVALPPVTGGEAHASDTTDTANSRPPHRLPKLLDGDGVDANQSR
jgi:hypothetical protein